MKNVYIDSRLRSLAIAWRAERPKTWVFSQGRPWLLLTPARLARLAALLGLEDERIARLILQVRRHSPTPSSYCRPLGIVVEDPAPDGRYPFAICPVCDSVHHPHPLDAGLACPRCREQEEVRRRRQPTPGRLADALADSRVRDVIRANDPGAFDDGVLSPNWKLNRRRRLERDWDAAVNRILTGGRYRRVAREFDCSVGLLHKKVHECRAWENN